MNYDVVWNLESIDQLQRIFDASDDQASILTAVKDVGRLLARNPTGAGESRDPGKRILFVPPLVVWFRIEIRLSTVVIYEIGPMRK